MGILNICGFESGGTYEIHGNAISGAGTGSIQSSVKRSGSYAYRSNPTTTAVSYVAIAGITNGGEDVFDVATAYYRFYFYAATLPAANNEDIFWAASSTNTRKMAVAVTSGGLLLVRDKDGGTLATGAVALSTATWYRIEASCGNGASAAYEVKLFLGDSTSALETLSGTGDMRGVNNFRGNFGKVINTNGQSVDFYYDDIAISDTAYPGPGKILAMVPNNDGAYTTWTVGAGAGADYLQVVPPDDGDTTYLLSTSSIGDASTVAFQSAAAAGISASSILAVKAVMGMKRDGAGNGTVRGRFRSDTTDTDTGGDIASTSTYNDFSMVFATDPATAAAWVSSGLNLVECGLIERETTDKTRWTSAWLMVDFIAAAPSAGRMRVIICG